MSEAGKSSQNPSALMQPYLDPTLTANGRIIPALGNPKGYPPYKLSKVLGYTNNQILYYLC
jgi:hypothetical protein